MADSDNHPETDAKATDNAGDQAETEGSSEADHNVGHDDGAATDDAGSAAESAQPKADADMTPAELLVALETARETLSAAQDQALRSKADMENLRRRSARDVENAHKFALEKFSKALIPVFESLEKAEASKADANDAESAAAVLEGVSLSLKLFKDTLEKQGVSQIDPHGEPFDPNVHEAVAMVPMPSAEPNSVIEVIRKGFDLNGRLIQAAQVVVSKAADS